MASSLTSSLIIKNSVVRRVGSRWKTYSVNQGFCQGGSLLWSAGEVLVERLLILEVRWRLNWQGSLGGNIPVRGGIRM